MLRPRSSFILICQRQTRRSSIAFHLSGFFSVFQTVLIALRFGNCYGPLDGKGLQALARKAGGHGRVSHAMTLQVRPLRSMVARLFYPERQHPVANIDSTPQKISEKSMRARLYGDEQPQLDTVPP